MVSKDIVDVIKTITYGTVIVNIVLGCYKYGYGIQGTIDEIKFALLPQNHISINQVAE